MSATRLDDGKYTVAAACAPLIAWIDPETRAVMFSQEFEVDALSFAGIRIGTAGPNYSFLIEETEPRHIGNALVRWTRLYAQLPPNFPRTEIAPHTYQFIQDGNVVNVTIPVTAQIITEWFHTPDSTRIDVAVAFKLVQSGRTILQNGNAPSASDTFFLGEDQKVTQWRGNWWRRVSIMVPNYTFVAQS